MKVSMLLYPVDDIDKALPLFNDGGSILMTGSNASLRGYPGWSVYAASKAVLPAYARVWVAELRDRRIRVNVLTPGSVTSPTIRSTPGMMAGRTG